MRTTAPAAACSWPHFARKEPGRRSASNTSTADWESYLWVFLMPVLFMYFIGTVTSQFGGSGQATSETLAVVVPSDAGWLGEQIIERLEQNGYQVDRCAPRSESGDYSRRLVLPNGFTETALRGEKAVVRFERTGEGLARDYDRFRVSRAVYTLLADLVVCANEGRPPDADAFAKLRVMPRSVTVDVRPAGERKEVPTGFE